MTPKAVGLMWQDTVATGFVPGLLILVLNALLFYKLRRETGTGEGSGGQEAPVAVLYVIPFAFVLLNFPQFLIRLPLIIASIVVLIASFLFSFKVNLATANGEAHKLSGHHRTAEIIAYILYQGPFLHSRLPHPISGLEGTC